MAKPRTVRELNAHIYAVARAFRIELHIDPNRHMADALAGKFYRPSDPTDCRYRVFVAPITSEETYVAALHELAHCIAPTGFIEGSVSNVRLKLEQEYAAWDWARRLAIDWTPTMEHVATLALKGYEDGVAALKVQEQHRAALDVRRAADAQRWARKLKL